MLYIIGDVNSFLSNFLFENEIYSASSTTAGAAAATTGRPARGSPA
jgi:hypothetical protein